MAENKNGILGPVTGKVGTVVGVKWRGIDVIRAKPQKSVKPPSTAQLLQRSKLAMASSFLSPLRKQLNHYIPSTNSKQVGFDIAMSILLKNAMPLINNVYAFEYQKIVFALGYLHSTSHIKAKQNKNNTIKFQWEDNSNNGIADEHDKLTLLCYNETETAFLVVEHCATRSTKQTTIQLPPNWNVGKVHFWSIWVNTTTMQNSTSSYLTVLDLQDELKRTQQKKTPN